MVGSLKIISNSGPYVVSKTTLVKKKLTESKFLLASFIFVINL